MYLCINPFDGNILFLYHLKTSENFFLVVTKRHTLLSKPAPENCRFVLHSTSWQQQA